VNGHILLFDDDIGLLDALKIALAFEGFDVTATSISKELYPLIEKVKPDILILDVNLGNIDGRDVSRSLKKYQKTYNIPIILISAFKQNKKAISKAKADDFLEKPFEIDELIEKIHKFLPKTAL
jgi:DNA-binding response OmpR family regulator